MASVRARSKDVGNDREFLIASKGPAGGAGSPSLDGARSLRWPLWLKIALAALAITGVAMLFMGFKSVRVEPYQHDSFITVKGTQFMHKCRPFYLVGFNVDNLGEALLAQPSRAAAGGGPTGVDAIREVLQTAAASGFNTIRTWAHTTNPNRPFQLRPGQYDERVFASLDVVIAEAERAGLRVILSLADNWKYEGGVDEMVDWSGTAGRRDEAFPLATQGDGDVSEADWTPERREYEAKRKALFFVDEGAREIYKGHVSAVVNRVNTVTGRRYAEDPTIMAFDLLNEPRCLEDYTPGCADRLSAWVKEMAAYLRSIDANHLVTVGEEGFWGKEDADAAHNPGAAVGSDWAARVGQDFVAQHAEVDFATAHVWPDNWQTRNETFLAEWVRAHVRSAGERLGKPVVLEEFGKKLGEQPLEDAVIAERDPVFRGVYAEAEGALGAGGALGGTLFWRWGFNAWNAWAVGEYGVLPADSTFRIARGHARRVKAFQNTAPPFAPVDAEAGAEGERAAALETGAGCAADAGCWVGVSRLGIARCELQPAVCQRNAEEGALQLRSAVRDGRLQSAGVETFASHAECCLPGLGAFVNGCHTKI